MKDQITLIIILHNRHANLDRLLEYYSGQYFSIIIADSSSEEHVFVKERKPYVKYSYTPGLTYTQKVEIILQQVTTDYVALCADDDFIIAEGLFECAAFLNDNPGYCVAQGVILKYYQNTIGKKLRYDMVYKGDHSLSSENAVQRMENLFNPYKSLLYALHRTPVLKEAFQNAGAALKNLYLNEYLTSIIPIFKGKSKDLTCLYQVREYAEASDDKTAENIDVVLHAEKYKIELQLFLDHLAGKIDDSAGLDKNALKAFILKELNNYASQIESFKKAKTGFKKRIGYVVGAIPFVGKQYVQNNRYKQSIMDLRKYLTKKDFVELDNIEKILKQYKSQ